MAGGEAHLGAAGEVQRREHAAGARERGERVVRHGAAVAHVQVRELRQERGYVYDGGVREAHALRHGERAQRGTRGHGGAQPVVRDAAGRSPIPLVTACGLGDGPHGCRVWVTCRFVTTRAQAT
jgi:hypothetical protein